MLLLQLLHIGELMLHNAAQSNKWRIAQVMMSSVRFAEENSMGYFCWYLLKDTNQYRSEKVKPFKGLDFCSCRPSLLAYFATVALNTLLLRALSLHNSSNKLLFQFRIPTKYWIGNLFKGKLCMETVFLNGLVKLLYFLQLYLKVYKEPKHRNRTFQENNCVIALWVEYLSPRIKNTLLAYLE